MAFTSTTNGKWMLVDTAAGLEFFEEGEGTAKVFYKRDVVTLTRMQTFKVDGLSNQTQNAVGDISLTNPDAYVNGNDQVKAQEPIGNEKWVCISDVTAKFAEGINVIKRTQTWKAYGDPVEFPWPEST